jgi:hypothetical protein
MNLRHYLRARGITVALGVHTLAGHAKQTDWRHAASRYLAKHGRIVLHRRGLITLED